MTSPNEQTGTGDGFAPGFGAGLEDTIDAAAGPSPLFDGDIGSLPEQLREVLVMLLKRRYLSSEEHPREYRLVLEHEPALRTRLNDQFLDLVVDREHQIAYKRQAVGETGDKYPTLLYDQAYSREETILLYSLRKLLSGAGVDAVFVDRSDLLEHVERFRPTTATDAVGDTRATNTAIDALVKQGLLLKTNQTDRFRIPTIVRVLLDVRRLQQLRAWLQEANGTSPDGGNETVAELPWTGLVDDQQDAADPPTDPRDDDADDGPHEMEVSA